MSTPRVKVGALTGCLVLLVSSVALAGPLNPPAGPIVPTPGPEPRTAINGTNTPGDADSVFKITQAGSYYLTGNVGGANGLMGIEVAATSAQVTIDLNGFGVIGVAGSLQGIRNTGSAQLAVRNGMVSGWGQDGIRNAVVVENVQVIGNTGAGISSTTFGTAVTNCFVSGNGSSGAYGINVTGYSTVTDCVVTDNGGPTAGGGIIAGGGSMIRRCVVSTNADGASSGSGHGIAVGSDSTVSDCRVNDNGSIAATGTGGISLSVGASVLRCELYFNRSAGIRVNGEGTVSGNTVVGTGGTAAPGIVVTGPRMIVEGNHLIGNPVGLRVNTTNCVVMRNVARGNSTNYSVDPGNDVGPISTAAALLAPNGNIEGP